MKANIRNRKTVALAITKTKLSGGNPDKHFAEEVGSRMLYHNREKLTVTANNRKNPDAEFYLKSLGNGATIWAPRNKAAENYLTGLTEKEFNDFIHHQPPPAVPASQRPESRRVVDGGAIKALPKGRREGDYFDAVDGSTKTPGTAKAKPATRSKAVVTTDDNTPVPPMSDDFMAQMRNAISNNVTEISS